MLILGTLSELLLYTCFALLMGDYILAIVPDTRKPKVMVPKSVRLLVVVGIVLFSFVPILKLFFYLREDYGAGGALESILLTFTVGQSWLITFLLSIILGMFTVVIDGMEGRRYPLVGIGLTVALILCMGWAGHAASMYPVQGFLTHVLHFLAVSVWIGVLFVVGYFSEGKGNWRRFLKWFHIIAVVCFLITLGTGLLMMQFIVTWESYTESWILPYGQSLLIKHILIIPLLMYALVNGTIIKGKLKREPTFNPKPWVRIEFVVVALVYSATGAMGQQSPPHNLESLLEREGASRLFTLFHGDPGTVVDAVTLSPNVTALLTGGIAVIFLALGFVSFVKKISPIFSFFMSMLFLVGIYVALMLSVQII
ncbi:CopD family protein [Salimicrobium sp. PL1-032A]|uniref:copper resistance D family protein n=1 Tax=Salimicrobium sp. PL1-032A TaxID=3095364 RepID=UPI0032613B12